MATRVRIPAERTATMIHSALLMAGEEGLTKPELLEATGLSGAQFTRGYDLLKDTLHMRGTPINVSRAAPFRYSIPLPINAHESSFYELRRLAIIANTSLERLQKHALAARSHHPHEVATFELLAQMANSARTRIAKTLVRLDGGGS